MCSNGLRLDGSPAVPYRRNAMTDRDALRDLLDDLPYGAAALARDAGVSDRLLRMVRDGDRRLTPEVRDALVEALVRRIVRLGEAVEALEDLDP